VISPPKNAILEALRYQQYLEAVPGRTRAEIAVMFGKTRARVTQMMNLLKLPAQIVTFLSECQEPVILEYFTERRLRPLIQIRDMEETLTTFDDMLEVVMSRNG
jgi:hypothetical protein